MTDQGLVISYFRSLGSKSSDFKEIKTALSYIFLLDDAYKLKQAIDADYIDFTDIEVRKACCLNEVRVNGRYAPEIYYGVKAVVPKGDSFSLEPLDAEGAVDYVVHMYRFGDDLLAKFLKSGEVSSSQIRKLTSKIADFHHANPYSGPFGTYEMFMSNVVSVFDVLDLHIEGKIEKARAHAVKESLLARLAAKSELFESRSQFRVRGHGDLHAKNVCLLNGVFVPFDGLEFSEELVCIDRMADVAFLVMDLVRHGREDLAYAAINQYLEETRDFGGLELLLEFCCYRAIVRSMVSAKEKKWSDSREYLEVAEYFLKERPVFLVAVGGLSGTGKSTVNKGLVEHFGGIQLRSDVIRKELLNLKNDASATEFGYSEEVTARTYKLLVERARVIMELGFPVFVDATFRSESARSEIEQFVSESGVPFVGIWCEVPPEVALARIDSRQGDASDADTAVRLAQQRESVGTISWMRLDCSPTISQVRDSAGEIVRTSLSS